MKGDKEINKKEGKCNKTLSYKKSEKRCIKRQKTGMH
jgi:hypothetical protein